MKRWFTASNLPMTLMVSGLALNVIDIATTPTGTTTGGKLFGPGGALKAVNDALPVVYVPGTKSEAYVNGVPLNLGGYMIVAGLIWWLIRRFA